jgi:hypothetical protein
MKTATVKELKQELLTKSASELVELNLRLAKFKKDNKELLTYLLYESQDEEGYILHVKEEMDEAFFEMNRASYYLMKKSLRKILRQTKQHIRYSGKKETEIELLMYFCLKMKGLQPPYFKHLLLLNLYDRQIAMIKKAIEKLHEDLQYDYQMELEKLL